MAHISVVINTLNEEENLPRVLASVRELAEEIVVTDMHSEDKTVEIAKKFGARVFLHERTGYVEPARNFALSKAKGEWILLLDADEEIGEELSKKLTELSNESKVSYYAVPRKNIVFGKWLENSRWWPDYNIRFFKRGAVKWEREIHSVPLTSGKGGDLLAEEKYAIIHRNYDSISAFIQRGDKYSTVMAKELHEKGEHFSWKQLISKPTGEFLSRYFAGEGYKDGVHGLAVSSLQAFVELATYLKLWELSKFPERELKIEEVNSILKASQREINYWTADTFVKETGGLTNVLKRKFKLP